MAPSSWMGRFILVFALIGGSGPLHAADSDAPVEAVWHKQSVNFQYHGFSTYYTCSGLREKLRRILINIGARETLQLHGYSCSDQGSARFRITFESPVVATAQNVQALTTYSAEELLAARTRGEYLPTAQDLPRFPALWKTVSFSRDRRLALTPGDCELVEQIRRAILPRLAVEVIHDRLNCSPSGNLRAPRLTVVALVEQRQGAL